MSNGVFFKLLKLAIPASQLRSAPAKRSENLLEGFGKLRHTSRATRSRDRAICDGEE